MRLTPRRIVVLTVVIIWASTYWFGNFMYDHYGWFGLIFSIPISILTGIVVGTIAGWQVVWVQNREWLQRRSDEFE
jgi:hypothetical protein